jgi:hypothetical protein
MSIELDFAFIAEWARAEDGASVTAASAGLRRVVVEAGEPVLIFVAGRFSRTLDDGEHNFSLTFEAEDGGLSVQNSALLTAAPAVGEMPEGLVAFAIRLPLPEVATGEYRATISIDDAQLAVLPLSIVVLTTSEAV